MNNSHGTNLSNTTNTTSDTTETTQNCWRKIGVWGDRSCPELKKQIHCRNCFIYAAAGRSLLEREAPLGYLDEWTETATQDIPENYRLNAANRLSVGIFRLGAEWLALPAQLFKEVTQVQTIHTIPHRSNKILQGLVNIRGEILMCISMMELLGLEPTTSHQIDRQGQVVYPRMVVVTKDGYSWVFAVDEIQGIHAIHRDRLQESPTTISKRTETYTKGLMFWQDRPVGYLDDELLFYTLSRRVL